MGSGSGFVQAAKRTAKLHNAMMIPFFIVIQFSVRLPSARNALHSSKINLSKCLVSILQSDRDLTNFCLFLADFNAKHIPLVVQLIKSFIKCKNKTNLF